METALQSPEQILLSHLQAIGTGNLDLLMQDYTEASVFITPSGVYKGMGQIRGEFERLLAAYPPGSTFNLIQQTLEEDYIYLIWSGESEHLQIPFATDTFLLKDGKIRLQTFAGQIIPKQ